MSTFPTVDKDTVLARAHAAMENRTKYIESLFDAANTAAAAHEKVADATGEAQRADAEHIAAYQEALDAGWTAAEIAESGLTAPATPTAKKPSRKASKRQSARTGTPARRRVGLDVHPAGEHGDNAPNPHAADAAPSPHPESAAS